MRGIDETVEIEQNEGKLEQAPGRRLLLSGRLSVQRRAALAIGSRPSRGS